MMPNSTRNEPQELPRARYEDRQDGDARPLSRFAFGMLLVNALLLAKDLLFGPPASAEPRHVAEPGESHGVRQIDQPGVGDDADPASADNYHEPGAHAAPLSFPPTSLGLELEIATDAANHRQVPVNRLVFHGSGDLPVPPAPGNDNDPPEPLTFAAPGVDGGAESEPAPGAAAPGPYGPRSGDNDDDDDRQNRAPVVTSRVTLGEILTTQSMIIGALELLRSSIDPDGDELRVLNLAATSGTLTPAATGQWTYTPTGVTAGDVVFTYVVSDGTSIVPTYALLNVVGPSEATPASGSNEHASDDSHSLTSARTDDIEPEFVGEVAPVELSRATSPVLGTDGNDHIVGTGGDDVIFAGAGDDTIEAAGGDDTIDAGTGDDVIVASVDDGNDTVDGGLGSDTLDMSGIIDDAVVDLTANSARSIDSGTDMLASIENVITGSGDDKLTGSAADNIIATGAGEDVIEAAGGDDTIDAGTGDDVIVASVDDGHDTVDGGAGSDTLDMSSIGVAVVIDLSQGYAASDMTGNDILTGIENACAGAGDDVIVANDAVNVLTGGDGDDVFVFTASYDAGNGSGWRDRILDFDVGDRIDLDDISREFAIQVEDMLADQSIRHFVVLRDNAGFSQPGQLRIVYEELDENSSITIIEGNIDYDADSEFQIELIGHHEFGDDQLHHH